MDNKTLTSLATSEEPSARVPDIHQNGQPLLLGSHQDVSHSNVVVPGYHRRTRLLSETSAINDGGDEQQLNAQDERIEPCESPIYGTAGEGDNALRHVGGGFSQIPYPDGSLDVSSRLDEEIRSAMLESIWSVRGDYEASTDQYREFLPVDELEKIINKKSVENEIKSWGDRSDEEVARLVHGILRQHSVCDASGNRFPRTTRRRLFAILVMANSAQSILGMIDKEAHEAIYDSHLPFTFDRSSKTMKIQWTPDGPLEDIAAFSSWTLREHDLFRMYQWQVLAPYFTLGENPDMIYTYKLEGMRPLPFIKIDGLESPTDRVSGGFSEVRRIRIHEAHHSRNIASNTHFAIKTLFDNSPDAFGGEVKILKWISKQRNPYVTELLAIIEHGTNRSLIFHWATGNLLNFWESTKPGSDASWVRWMAKQFAGLASVIKLVHGPMRQVLDDTQGDKRHLQPNTQYGRHGDLKPENILLFNGPEHDDNSDSSCTPGGPSGILKVADFGLAAFHSKNSQRLRASRTARSKTYRAPEYDEEEVTPCADIWSFGCILLEFLVWYEDGTDGAQSFAKRRLEEEQTAPEVFYVEDKFFIRSSTTGQVITLKDSVIQEIIRLRQGSRCSEFSSDVLDLIEEGLLQVVPGERFSCDVVHEKLQTISKNAIERPDYCTKMTRASKYTAPTDTQTPSSHMSRFWPLHYLLSWGTVRAAIRSLFQHPGMRLPGRAMYAIPLFLYACVQGLRR